MRLVRLTKGGLGVETLTFLWKVEKVRKLGAKLSLAIPQSGMQSIHLFNPIPYPPFGGVTKVVRGQAKLGHPPYPPFVTPTKGGGMGLKRWKELRYARHTPF